MNLLLPNTPLCFASVEDALSNAEAVAVYCAANAHVVDYDGAFPVEEFALIAETGLLAVSLPDSQGGLGLGSAPQTTLPLLKILKHFGRGNLAVGRIYEGHVNALHLITTFGTEEQISDCAANVHRHHCLCGVWNTQDQEGVYIYALGNDRYRLQGAKTFASGAGYVNRPLVTGMLIAEDGRTEMGWQMFTVPMDEVRPTIDASWWQPLGMRASASFRVDFTGAELDSSGLIGKPGDYYRQPWFSGGALRFAAVQLGGAEALADTMRQYLRELARSGDAFQQGRAGEVAILVESGDLWLRGAAQIADSSAMTGGAAADDTANCERVLGYANMTRTAIEGICLDVMRLVERSVGARGLRRPHPVERIHRDLTMYLRQPATDAALADAGRYALDSALPIHTLWSHKDASEEDPNIYSGF